MKNLQELRGRRDVLAKELTELVDKEKTPNWGPAQQEKYDQAMSEIADIDNSIKRHADVMARIGEAAAAGGQVDDDLRNRFTTVPGAHNSPEEGRALRAFLSGGFQAMDPTDVQRVRARQTGDIRNAMSTTTNSEGGYTVATEYYRELEQAMKAFGGIRQAARVMATGTGAQMNFPAADATSEVGEIVGQNAATNGGDTTFQNISIDVYKYSSKKIAVPLELIQDSMFDIEGYINAVLAMRIGRITAQHFTTGSGSSQPRGLVTAAGVGKIGASGQTLTVTYDDLVDLEHSVDPAYRSAPGVGWMMHDTSLKVVRKIKDLEGRPMFVPGYAQSNPGGAPDTLMGKPIYISQEMPVPAANAKSIAYGDYGKYLIREVMDLTIFRMMDSAFILNGQVGFVAFNRQGGNLIDVGGAVKTYQNSAT